MHEVLIDSEAQVVPSFLYKRVEVGHIVERVIFTIDYGYSYVLERISSKWPDADTSPATLVTPQILIEIFSVAAGTKAHQNEPYPLRLISTPAEPGVLSVAAPSPVDATGFNVNMTATPRKGEVELDYLFAYRSTIDIKISGQQLIAATWFPQFVDVVLEGYAVPEQQLAIWSQKG